MLGTILTLVVGSKLLQNNIDDTIDSAGSEVKDILKEVKNHIKELTDKISKTYQENLNLTLDSLDAFTSNKLREFGDFIERTNELLRDDILLAKETALEILAEAKKTVLETTKAVEESVKKVIIVAGETADFVLDKAIYNILTLSGWILLGVGLLVIIAIYAKRGIPEGLAGILVLVFTGIFLVLFAMLALIPRFRTWIMKFTGLGLKARVERRESQPLVLQVDPNPIVPETKEFQIRGDALLPGGKRPSISVNGINAKINAATENEIAVSTNGLDLSSLGFGTQSVQILLTYADKNLEISCIAKVHNPPPKTVPILNIVSVLLAPPEPVVNQPAIATVTVLNNGQKDAGAFEIIWKPDGNVVESIRVDSGLKINEQKAIQLSHVYRNAGKFTSLTTIEGSGQIKKNEVLVKTASAAGDPCKSQQTAVNNQRLAIAGLQAQLHGGQGSMPKPTVLRLVALAKNQLRALEIALAQCKSSHGG